MQGFVIHLIPQMIIEIGSVKCRVAAGAETGSLRQAAGMGLLTDYGKIHLGMTTQT